MRVRANAWMPKKNCQISLSHSFRKLRRRKIVEGSNYETFLWFSVDLLRRCRGTIILHDVVLCSLDFWLEIPDSDLLIRQISILHRILTKFDILLEILQCLTEISSKFSRNWGFSARSEWSSPCSCGNDWSLTLHPFERLLALQSAFGCPLFANCLCSHSNSSCFARFLGI